MVHSGIFATSSEILTKAGKNYDTGVTEAKINELCLQAEALINAMTKFNWSDQYASLNADVKGILSDAEASWVSQFIVAYNMGGYNSKYEAVTVINLCRDSFTRDIEILKGEWVQDFVKGA